VADVDHGHRAITDGAHHLKAGRDEGRESKGLLHHIDSSVKPMGDSASTSSKLRQSPYSTPIHNVTEFWLENRLMIEVISPAMAQEYQAFMKSAQLSVMDDQESLRLMRATHTGEPV
jgi:hypothetical protein